MHFLADKNATMGMYSQFTQLLFCSKNDANLTRFSIDQNHTFTLKSHLMTLTGEAKGDKHIEGDLKTPVGVYKLNSRIDEPAPFYGPLALVTNYPNKYDQAQGKNGHGIWIHGYPLKGERDPYTKGCLAIDNTALSLLNKRIDYTKSILIISPKAFPYTNKQTIATILSELYKWRNAWKQSDLTAYLAFYNENFKRSNGMSLTQFSIIKQSIFSNKVKRLINFHHINVIPYPNEENRTIFYVSFIEKYDAGRIHFNGTKELYLEFINNKISILTEN